MNLRRLKDSFPGRVLSKFQEDQGPKQAALIAWNALGAMFPILVFIASILGLFLSLAGFKAAQFYADLVAVIPDPNAQSQVLMGLDGVKRQSGLFFVIGLAGLLWGGANLFGAIEDCFALIYHTRNRGLVRGKLVAFAMMLLFTVLAGLVVATSALIPALQKLPYVPGVLTHGAASVVLQAILGVAAGFLLFGVIYYVIPNRRQSVRQVWAGALVAALVFELLTLAFPLYLAHANLNTYGKTFGLLLILITFFYFLGLITVIGVEVNSVLYPVPVQQPDRAGALAPARSGPEGEDFVRPSPSARLSTAWQRPSTPSNQRIERARRGVPPRVAVLLALAASAVGVMVGRRRRA